MILSMVRLQVRPTVRRTYSNHKKIDISSLADSERGREFQHELGNRLDRLPSPPEQRDVESEWESFLSAVRSTGEEVLDFKKRKD